MSWLGGSLSSLTGQLTNLTKDILTEGTEEVSDHATELRLASDKIKELEAVCSALRTENERIKRANVELEEKAESSELQINSISREYRALLEEKENKIKSLMQKHHELLEQQAKAAMLSASSPPTHHGLPPAASSNTSGGSGWDDFGGDELDFADSIGLQQEVNRLGQEVQRLTAESHHWKTVAGQLGESNEGAASSVQQVEQLSEWKAKVKSLEAELAQERERQRAESASLQDAYNQKVTALKRRHKTEVSDLQERLTALEQQLAEGKDGDGLQNNGASVLPESEREQREDEGVRLRQQLSVLETQLSSLHQDCQTLGEEREGLQARVQQLEGERQGLLTKVQDQESLISTLKQQLDHSHSEEILQLREQLKKSEERCQELEKQQLQRQEVMEDLAEARADQQLLQQQTVTMLESMGNPEHQQLTAELMQSLGKETQVLRERNLQLEEQVAGLEKLTFTLTEEKQKSHAFAEELQRQLRELQQESSTKSASTLDQSLSMPQSSRSSLDADSLDEQSSSRGGGSGGGGREKDEVGWRAELERLELERSDLQMEKEALEDVLMTLRQELQDKDTALQQLQASKAVGSAGPEEDARRCLEMEEQLKKNKSLLNKLTAEKENYAEKIQLLEKQLGEYKVSAAQSEEECGSLRSRLEQREKDVEAAKQECSDLETSLGELDHQHSEATTQLLSIRDGLSKQVDKLSRQLVDRDSEVKELRQQLAEANKELQATKENNVIAELEEKLEEQTEQITRLQQKLIEAERQVEEASQADRSWQEMEQAVRTNATQSEAELSSQLADQELEIDRLTRQLQKLQERLEAKERKQVRETMTASGDDAKALEVQQTGGEEEEERDEDLWNTDWSDLESASTPANSPRDARITELEEKLQRGAVAVNNLHMDKRELEEKLRKAKEEAAAKSARIKELREQHAQLSEANAELEQRLQEMEEEVDKWQQVNEDAQVDQKKLKQENEQMRQHVQELEALLEQSKRDSTSQSHDQLSSIQNQLQVSQSQLASISGAMHAKEEALQHSQQELENCRTEISTLTTKLQESEVLCTRLKSELGEQATVQQKVEEQLQTESRRESDLTSSLAESTSHCKELEQQVKGLSANKTELEGRIGHLQKALEAALKAREGKDALEDAAGLREAGKLKDAKISDLQAALEALEVELEQTQTALHESTQAQAGLRETSQKQQKHFESEKHELGQQVQLLTSQLQEQQAIAAERAKNEGKLQEELLSLQQQLDNLTTAHAKASEEEQGQAEKELGRLRTDLMAAQDQLAKQASELSASRAQVEQLEGDLTTSKDLVFRLEEEVASSREEASRLEGELTANRELLSKLGLDLTASTEQTSNLEAASENFISQLEKELSDSKEEIARLQAELAENKSYSEQASEDQDRVILHLEAKIRELESVLEQERQTILELTSQVERLQDTIVEKDTTISSLADRLNHAEAEVQEKAPVEERFERATFFPLGTTGEEEIEDADNLVSVSQGMDELQKRLAEKDSIIDELQRNNASLLKMMEARSLTSSQGGHSPADFVRLENEVKSLRQEKEQIMAVMNEKSRESSSLRSEVHRLMSVVSAQKSALEKLQRDNAGLSNGGGEGSSEKDDMQREALNNMARLVRDRDMEIEALKQKTETLLAVLQDTSQDGAKLASSLGEMDELKKQVATLQSEREQLVAYVQQKHSESLAYHAEVTRLTELQGQQEGNLESLQQQYDQLASQFEENKQALLKANNELVSSRQKHQELEVRHGELLQRSGQVGSADQSQLSAREEELLAAVAKQAELRTTIVEKENQLAELVAQHKELEKTVQERDSERASLRKQLDAASFRLHGLEQQLADAQAESSKAVARLSQLDHSEQSLRDANAQLMLKLRDQEFEVRTLTEKTGKLTALLGEQQGEAGKVQHLMAEGETQTAQLRALQQERDQLALQTQQHQAHLHHLQQENQHLREKEMKLNRELERLRGHLLQIEEGYTREALEAEEREKELRNRLAVAEEKLASSSTAVENASQQASQQVELVQQRLQQACSQRDSAYQQLSALQDQCQQYAASLTNLQAVLEQFQHDKDTQVAVETERYQNEIKHLKERVNSLQSAHDQATAELEEAQSGLEAAARLSEVLDRKEEAIAALREEVQLREASLKTAEEAVQKLTSNTEAKVDRLLLKNILMGYFTLPEDKRGEALRTICGVLDFTEEEFEKVSGKHSGWIPSFLRFKGNTPTPSPATTPTRRNTMPSAQKPDQSFSQLFVKFLEKESSPPPAVARLPAEEMAQELQQKHRERERPNPFTAPRHVALPLSAPGTRTPSPTPHHLLMAPASSSLPLGPTLTSAAAPLPSPAGRTTPQNASAILKDVLGSR